MSQLPARLGETTLGDVLAALHRARVNATLELHEGARRHAVHLRGGMVQAVECSAPVPRFGEVVSAVGAAPQDHVENALAKHRARAWRVGQCLVVERLLSSRERDRLLDAQRAHRLECLYALADATVRLAPVQPLPEGAAEQHPMSERAAFHGRPRGRRHRGP